MKTYPVKMYGDEPTFPKPLPEILMELREGGALAILTPIEYISNQQTRWFKGVLLPALATDSGNTVGYWELKLKRAVLPEEFPLEVVSVEDVTTISTPSINSLSINNSGLR